MNHNSLEKPLVKVHSSNLMFISKAFYPAQPPYSTKLPRLFRFEFHYSPSHMAGSYFLKLITPVLVSFLQIGSCIIITPSLLHALQKASFGRGPL